MIRFNFFITVFQLNKTLLPPMPFINVTKAVATKSCKPKKEL